MQQLIDFKFTDTIVEIHEGEAWYSIVLDDLCCGLKKEYGAKPKVGDSITIHTNSDKYGEVIGMDLNGINIFKKSDYELSH